MPLDFFARKQALTCQVVAKKKETSWNPPALCLRLLLPDGSELEGQFVRGLPRRLCTSPTAWRSSEA